MSEGFCARMFFCAATVFALCGSAYVSLLLYQEKTSPQRDFFQRWESCLAEPKACAKDIKKHSVNFALLLKELETEFKSSKVMKKIAMEVLNDLLNPAAAATKENSTSSSLMEKQLMKALSQDPQSREQMLRLMMKQQNNKGRSAFGSHPMASPPATGQRGAAHQPQREIKNKPSAALNNKISPPSAPGNASRPPVGKQNPSSPRQPSLPPGAKTSPQGSATSPSPGQVR